jgi:hypothetical protein
MPSRKASIHIVVRLMLTMATVLIIMSHRQALAVSNPNHYGPSAGDLILGIPDNVPFAGLKDGRVTGIIAEATVKALETIGWGVTLHALPFKRMYHWVHTGRIDVAVSVLRTPARAALARLWPFLVFEKTPADSVS